MPATNFFLPPLAADSSPLSIVPPNVNVGAGDTSSFRSASSAAIFASWRSRSVAGIFSSTEVLGFDRAGAGALAAKPDEAAATVVVVATLGSEAAGISAAIAGCGWLNGTFGTASFALFAAAVLAPALPACGAGFAGIGDGFETAAVGAPAGF